MPIWQGASAKRCWSAKAMPGPTTKATTAPWWNLPKPIGCQWSPPMPPNLWWAVSARRGPSGWTSFPPTGAASWLASWRWGVMPIARSLWPPCTTAMPTATPAVSPPRPAGTTPWQKAWWITSPATRAARSCISPATSMWRGAWGSPAASPAAIRRSRWPW